MSTLRTKAKMEFWVIENSATFLELAPQIIKTYGLNFNEQRFAVHIFIFETSLFQKCKFQNGKGSLE